MKQYTRTFVLGLVMMTTVLIALYAPITQAAAPHAFSVIAETSGANCPKQTGYQGKYYYCLEYDMELRHDLVSNLYYAWVMIYPGDDQKGKIGVNGIQLNTLNIGLTTNPGQLLYSDMKPVHSAPVSVGQPLEVGTIGHEVSTKELQTLLAEHAYYPFDIIIQILNQLH